MHLRVSDSVSDSVASHWARHADPCIVMLIDPQAVLPAAFVLLFTLRPLIPSASPDHTQPFDTALSGPLTGPGTEQPRTRRPSLTHCVKETTFAVQCVPEMLVLVFDFAARQGPVGMQTAWRGDRVGGCTSARCLVTVVAVVRGSWRVMVMVDKRGSIVTQAWSGDELGCKH
eukprot:3941656-Rhodomonas_salina.2